MKTVILIALITIAAAFAVVSANIEGKFLESSSCSLFRNHNTGEKKCSPTEMPISEWTLVAKESKKCIPIEDSCTYKFAN